MTIIFSAIIRECFPKSILLGSVENPVKITEKCDPVNVESDGSIAACICTTDFCNNVEDHQIELSVNDDTLTDLEDHHEQVIDEIDINVDNVETTTVVVSTSTSTAAPKFSRIICHQCGSLFSNKNSDCEVFDENDKSQQGFCDPGEACLWYSWQKTKEQNKIRDSI